MKAIDVIREQVEQGVIYVEKKRGILENGK